jgi:hypothetical protein
LHRIKIKTYLSFPGHRNIFGRNCTAQDDDDPSRHFYSKLA